MFEVGKLYYITTGEADHAGSSIYTVVEIALPLIKVAREGGSEEIINTSSPLFHGAKPVDPKDMTGDFDEF